MRSKLKYLVRSLSKNGRQILILTSDLFAFRPITLTCSLLLMLARSISASVSLLLIIPLLHVLGFALGASNMNHFDKVITNLFLSTHLPLNLPTVLFAYIIIVSLAALVAYAEQWLNSVIQQKFSHHLRCQLFEAIVGSTWTFIQQQRRATLSDNLTTQIQTISTACYNLLNLINNAILVCVYSALALLLSWKMTIIAIASAVFLLAMMLPLYKRTASAGETQIQQGHTVVHELSEQLNLIKMIKVWGYEKQFTQEIKGVSASLEQQNQYFVHILAVSKLLYSVGSVIIFSILLYFALTVIALPLPSLMMLLVVFLRILPRVSTMQQTYQRMIHQVSSYTEVKQLLRSCMANQEKSDVQSPPLSFNESITLDNIHFSYPQKHAKALIKKLSFSIKKNTTTAVIGPSGVGKSTLADLIVGLINPNSGQIYIDKTPLNESNKLAWRKSIAYVAQEHLLLNKSIRQNLQLFSTNQSEKDLWDALRSASAAGFVEALDQGLDTIIGEQGVKLSGGERQRISLARALLSKPELLILDECTSSLDKSNITEIQKALRHIHGKVTILIISHQMDMWDLADQKIVLGSAGKFAVPDRKELLMESLN